jgi:hypothetical protein
MTMIDVCSVCRKRTKGQRKVLSGLFSFFAANFITRGKVIKKLSLYTCS